MAEYKLIDFPQYPFSGPGVLSVSGQNLGNVNAVAIKENIVTTSSSAPPLPLATSIFSDPATYVFSDVVELNNSNIPPVSLPNLNFNAAPNVEDVQFNGTWINENISIWPPPSPNVVWGAPGPGVNEAVNELHTFLKGEAAKAMQQTIAKILEEEKQTKLEALLDSFRIDSFFEPREI